MTIEGEREASTWPSPPTSIGTEPGVVHVWRFRLDPPGPVIERFRSTLREDERARAERFRTETLRRRFIAGRGGLRAVLGFHLDVPAGDVVFRYGAHGKPALDDDPGLGFNLAHSHDLALLAVASGRAVGVDVEALRPMAEAERIITRFFSPCEQAEFLALPADDRQAAFFRGWTRKEAYLKAVGTGLATRLDGFDVTLGSDAPAALRRVGDDPAAADRWALLDLDPGSGYAGALAVEVKQGDGVVLRLWEGLPALP